MQDYPWWNDSQRELMKEAQKFTDEMLIPIAEKCVHNKEYPWEAIRLIGEKGWFGATIPEEYGGHQKEWGVTGACILCEEVGRAGTIASAYTTSIIGATQQILHDGTEEQKQRWLPKLAKAELLGCITMTEPYAGSDIAAIETTGVRHGDHFIVNGIKRFQTGSAAADLYMSYVKTIADPGDRKRYKHLTGMIIEKGMPGFSIERVNDWSGSAGMYNCYLRFDSVKVPVDWLFNRLMKLLGFCILQTLDLGRMSSGKTFQTLFRNLLREVFRLVFLPMKFLVQSRPSLEITFRTQTRFLLMRLTDL